jgi:hypothetical protein
LFYSDSNKRANLIPAIGVSAKKEAKRCLASTQSRNQVLSRSADLGLEDVFNSVFFGRQSKSASPFGINQDFVKVFDTEKGKWGK